MDETPIWLKLGITLVVVVLNGFFVAAEFALVKTRPGRIEALVREGNGRARVVHTILERLDLYLSGCQLGITLASLVLGWLAEPAVASLLIALAQTLGWEVTDHGALHFAAIGVALAIITTFHMTIGEQAPKIWAIERAERASLLIAYPLYWFVFMFQPLIWMINQISNWMLRLVGVHGTSGHEGTHNVQELKQIIGAAASGGKITFRQRMFADNVLGLVDLEVRHILLPRVDVEFLSERNTTEENLEKMRICRHSRYPYCKEGLDTVIGVVHSRDILPVLLEGGNPDLKEIARTMTIVPTTQPLSQFIVEAQKSRHHCALVVDERGTTTGMAFLEDALEEIVGPIQDEFDSGFAAIKELPDGCLDVPGSTPLPDVQHLFHRLEEEGVDTIGGYVTARLGRLPLSGDSVIIPPFRASVSAVARNRVSRLRLTPLPKSE